MQRLNRQFERNTRYLCCVYSLFKVKSEVDLVMFNFQDESYDNHINVKFSLFVRYSFPLVYPECYSKSGITVIQQL